MSRSTAATPSTPAAKGKKSASPEAQTPEVGAPPKGEFVSFEGSPFQLFQPYPPAGDQPTAIQQLVEGVNDGESFQTLLGVTGSGKTYSRHLIKHVLCDDPAMRCEFIVIDIEHDWYDTVTAGEFITKLATKMGIDGIVDVDPLVEHSRAARELVHQFVGRYRSLPRQARWVFIDGLDRTSVDPAVLIAVTQLAKEVEAGQLRDLRLIVTGHPCDFSPDVLDILLLESLDEITEHDLRQFFGHVADVAGHPLSGDELAALVDEVLAEAKLTDLHALGRKAGKLAHASFGPAGGAA